jgi:arsenite/tail-anchored protein-transporting ATPase
MQRFNPLGMKLSKFIFFTGKGGVGKTSASCATAVTLADAGKRVFLVSTDPASNLQDVFNLTLDAAGVAIPGVSRLTVANLDPIQAAAQYKESAIAPYRGKLPQDVIESMEEQLSGSCTVEIAAFNEFSKIIANQELMLNYDHVIFDTAPTGHTLRMLQLPSAWNDFIDESTHGASCLGQLSGLDEHREVYTKALSTLEDAKSTTLVLVARPETPTLIEAARSSTELAQIHIENQLLLINGYLDDYHDDMSKRIFDMQAAALAAIPAQLARYERYYIPLRAYNITGLDHVRALLTKEHFDEEIGNEPLLKQATIDEIIDQLYTEDKKVIFTMGKGGVGKTTIARMIAEGLAKRGKTVHLASTDPAASRNEEKHPGYTQSSIDEKEELRKYTEEMLTQAGETMGEDDIEYLKEDLRSPCTQEIAVFKAFAQIVKMANEKTVIIDTAPTGHTLLLMDATQSYHKEVQRSQGEIPDAVKNLLPRLRNQAETAVMIVTHAQTTPYYESLRLEEDLKRAGIAVKAWIINASLAFAELNHPVLKARANEEKKWIHRIAEHTAGNYAVVEWDASLTNGN